MHSGQGTRQQSNNQHTLLMATSLYDAIYLHATGIHLNPPHLAFNFPFLLPPTDTLITIQETINLEA
jgi:hypothetical protein